VGEFRDDDSPVSVEQPREPLFRERPPDADDDLRGYEPIHPTGLDLRAKLRRLGAPILVALGALLKFGAFSLKFFGIFIAFAGYTLIWGWRFAVGFIILLLFHEMGHYVEARWQGARPGLPVFVPFLGAYVAMKDGPKDPWKLARIAVAGPIAGGLAAAACYAASGPTHSNLLSALAYVGFFLNLFNLIPIAFFDGGNIWRSYKVLRVAGDPRATLVLGLYLGTAAMLVLGMYVSHVPQHRL
jgi:Zn-dependent protease